MRNGTALSVSLGIIALAIVAIPSLFVEGEATGTTAPGLHLTTEAVMAPLEPVETEYAGEVAGVDPQQAPTGQTQIIAQDAPKAAPALPGGVPKGYIYWKTVRAKVTAYEPSARSCGPKAKGRTSTGENAWVMDGIAADPRAIPYGSYVEIPGVGVKEVDDTGGAMRHYWRQHGKYQIDLRMTYVHQATRWGVKYLDIKLYKKAG